MKKTLLTVICISLFLFSCDRKSEVKKPSGISVTIDGVDKSYNVFPYANLYDGEAKGSNIILTAASNKESIGDSFQLEIKANSPLTKGTYYNDGSNMYLAIIYFVPNFNIFGPKAYVTDLGGTHKSTITITSISKTNIQGTFSAQLMRDDNTTMNVDNGKFNFDIPQ